MTNQPKPTPYERLLEAVTLEIWYLEPPTFLDTEKFSARIIEMCRVAASEVTPEMMNVWWDGAGETDEYLAMLNASALKGPDR